MTQGPPSDLKSRIESSIPRLAETWLAPRARSARTGPGPLGRAPLEPGDVFGPPPLHLFKQPEIEAELAAAGFRTDLYLSEGTYPHAVGIAN